ncbi:septal ring lytic transglycosylase RlpA family protein [Shewanella donghaensis]|uniref:septal ring lytic transglycosylase RlpA family protein n=1 Tax=Shewanella donghaensis TaxID=238836 RepID=UPI00386CE074
MIQNDMLKKSLLSLSAIALCGALSACSSSSPTSQDDRYQLKDDRAPKSAPDVSKVEDAHPKYEPYSRQGNKQKYTVRGKSYNVLPSAKDFKQSGNASWYGSKFHGHLTSNGETYDMYSMSAAHKTLPLPSYVRVTNEANNKQVIVRVNDRGPFHEGRIIDLSYAAAYKIGMLDHGTAKVSIETIHIESPESMALDGLKDTSEHVIQVVASKDQVRINVLAKQLEAKYQVTARVESANGFYRLQLGPIGQSYLANKLLLQLKQDGYPNSYLLAPKK